MQNWYAVYTRPNREKKICGRLAKLKLETYHPLNYTNLSGSRKAKPKFTPLFQNYVFVKMEEKDFPRVKKISGVVNFLYWLGAPAKIAEEEIKAIREFSDYYQDIKIEKFDVDMTGTVKFMDDPIYSREGNFISVKSKSVKVNLPSLGYKLIAWNRRPQPVQAPVFRLDNVSNRFSLLNFFRPAGS